jgi:hypothetical protein
MDYPYGEVEFTKDGALGSNVVRSPRGELWDFGPMPVRGGLSGRRVGDFGRPRPTAVRRRGLVLIDLTDTSRHTRPPDRWWSGCG